MSKVLFNLNYEGQVATITLNQPETYNAFDIDMILQLTKYFNQVANDSNIKLLVITANGKCFSSGANLVWMKSSINYTNEQNFQDAKQLAMMLWSLYNLNKPVICAIQGDVYGGAIGIVACSDVVITVKNSKFCFSEVKLGLAPAIVSPFVLQVMQASFAKYSMLTAKPFKVEQAYEFGLVHQIVETNSLQQAVSDNIDNILSMDFNGVTVTKQLLRNLNQQISLEQLDDCAKKIADLRTSKEAQFLINQFLQKINSKIIDK